MSTERLAQFVVQTRYEDLPQEAIATARRSILDCIGCALAARQEPTSRIIVQYVKGRGGRREAGVIGAGFRTIASEAAWANGTMSHVLDYDDYIYTSWTGHPTAAILPAVLALGEKLHLSGKEALAAYLLGFEVGSRVALTCGKHQYDLGWHNTATLGSIASAAASAKLLGLPIDETRRAIGIAASMAGGLRQNFGTMTKPLHAGNAARNGLTAALLAQKGFTADESILESPLGFCRVLGGGRDFDYTRLTASLGAPFDIVSPGVSLKPYPSCAGTHWAIDAALYLKGNYPIATRDIAGIEVRCDRHVPQVCIHSRPKNALEAKFSVEFCVALALIDGKVSLRDFNDEKVTTPEVQQLLAKVKFAHPPEYAEPGLRGEVVVKMRDGRTYSKKIEEAKGSPGNPLSWEEIVAKYRDCASLALGEESILRSIELASHLESVEDISELTAVVVG